MILAHLLVTAFAMASLCVCSTWTMSYFSYFTNSSSATASSNTYGDESVSNVKANGSAKLDGTTVSNLTEVNGKLTANDSTLNELNVNGSANLESCTIQGNASISGSLKGKDNTFEDTLTISSENTTLSSSSLQSIEVRKVNSSDDKQVIRLEKNTSVEGDITFASGNGEVIIDASSEVLGNVIGGTVIKTNPN